MNNYDIEILFWILFKYIISKNIFIILNWKFNFRNLNIYKYIIDRFVYSMLIYFLKFDINI